MVEIDFDESDLPEELQSSGSNWFGSQAVSSRSLETLGFQIQGPDTKLDVFLGEGSSKGVSVSFSTWGKSLPINRTLKKLLANAEDLSGVFNRMGRDFFKTNEKLIFRESPGRYKDLSDSYKDEKQRDRGFIYPVLFYRGTLKESLTNEASGNAIFKVSKKSMRLGTKVEYAQAHQEGNYNTQGGGQFMPARPPVLVDVGGRLQRWLGWINGEIFKNLAVKGG